MVVCSVPSHQCSLKYKQQILHNVFYDQATVFFRLVQVFLTFVVTTVKLQVLVVFVSFSLELMFMRMKTFYSISKNKSL